MKKLILPALFLITFPFFTSAQSPNLSSSLALLQAQIQDLLKQIQSLQQQVTALKTELGQQPGSTVPPEEIVSEASPPELTRMLSRGSSGNDVRELQEFLSRERDIYPEGLVTGYYGPLTEAAVKRWQAKHNMESAGVVGPKTIAQFNLIKEGRAKTATTSTATAGAVSVSPAQPVGETGTTTIPALPAQSAQSTPQQDSGQASTTSTQSTSTPATPACATDYSRCRVQKDCEGAGFFWYTVSCHRSPPPQSSCAASYNYCAGPTECSAHGWYWCRNSCYGTAAACLGETYVPPAQPAAIPAIPAVPATPAQPTSQTGTTTVAAVPAIPAQTAAITTSASSPYGSALDFGSISNDALLGKIWNPTSGIEVGSGLNYSTKTGIGWSQQYGGKFVTAYSIVASLSSTGIREPYLTQTNSVTVAVTGPAGSIIEVWDLETLKVVATNITNPGSPVIFTAQPNHRYGGFAWYVDNSEKDIAIYAAYSSAPPATPIATATTIATTTASSDTTAPSAPTNLTATAFSSTQINLSWSASTNTVGVTGYRMYRGGTQIATVTAGITYSDIGLVAATDYSYTVAAYDAAGNVSAQSVSASATTFSVELPAPRANNAYWSNIDNKNIGLGEVATFTYPTDSRFKTTIFRFYRKTPTDASFVLAAEFTGLDSTSCARRSIVGEWLLDGFSCTESTRVSRVKAVPTFNYGDSKDSFPASSYSVGEYKYYFTTVDSTGKESAPSATLTLVFFEPITILAPTESQSPVSSPPTFQWTVGSGWPQSFVHLILILDSSSATAPPFWIWTSTTISTATPGVNSFVYNGPALDPKKKYRVFIWGYGQKTIYEMYIALPSARTDFSVTSSTATTTSTISNPSLTLRAQNLAAVSEALDAIQEKLLKLLQEL